MLNFCCFQLARVALLCFNYFLAENNAKFRFLCKCLMYRLLYRFVGLLTENTGCVWVKCLGCLGETLLESCPFVCLKSIFFAFQSIGFVKRKTTNGTSVPVLCGSSGYVWFVKSSCFNQNLAFPRC